MVGEDLKHADVFQALKRTFMRVSGLPPPYFDNKTNLQSKFYYLKHA